ncbi:craniofacial development protein 2-like [Centruroides vittatus]|uniref:craniofacial development protein 2-like n=1 Tax=Centruroides vittatus TaxID=120091 RepID=UPI00350F445C
MARFEAKPFNITVIQVYAPISDSSEEEIELFYKDLSMIIEEMLWRDVIIIGGDWNTKIGNNNEGWERVMDQDLMICNTKFQQKNCRKWTWRSNDGTTRNMIDMILIQRRWSTSVQQCRTFQGANIDSDHSLVFANIKIKLKRKVNAHFQKKRDISRLNDEKMGSIYRDTLEKIKTLDRMEELDTRVEEIIKAIREAIEQTLPEEEKINKKWIRVGKTV